MHERVMKVTTIRVENICKCCIWKKLIFKEFKELHSNKTKDRQKNNGQEFWLKMRMTNRHMKTKMLRVHNHQRNANAHSDEVLQHSS